MQMEQLPPRKIRLKCRYDREIRTVVISPNTSIVEVKKRLNADFGFEVVLKYEDKDGDLITLSTQDDLNELFYYEDIDTLNVVVSESIALPQLNLKPVHANAKPLPGFASVGASREWSGRIGTSSAMTPTNHNNHALPKFPAPSTRTAERFPNINNNDSLSNRYQEHHDIRWKKGEVLGQGAFGIVYLGLNIDTGELMAVKQMATEEVSKRELSSLENEINLLRSLRHPNIVRYIGTELTSTSLSIFLEYVPGGSLKALIDKFGHLEEAVARSYTRQLLLGLEYLHRNGIAHRDIKGANCLVGNDGVIKLADFGSSKHWRPSPASSNAPTGLLSAGNNSAPSGDLKGTPAWMAPEVIRDQGINISWRKADIWSLGCTTLEMTTGKPPWSQFNNPVTILYHIACQETVPEYPHPASVELVTFLNVCFQRDPQIRPDVTSLLLHPFVASAGMSTTWGGQGNMMVRPSTMSSLLQNNNDNMEYSNNSLTFNRQSTQWGTASGNRRQLNDESQSTRGVNGLVPLSLNLPASSFPDIAGSRSRSSSQSSVFPPSLTNGSGTPRSNNIASGMPPPQSARSVNSNSSNQSTASHPVNPATAIFQRNNNPSRTLSISSTTGITSDLEGNNVNNSETSTPRVFSRQRIMSEDDYLLEKDHPENTGRTHIPLSHNLSNHNNININKHNNGGGMDGDGYMSDFTAMSLETTNAPPLNMITITQNDDFQSLLSAPISMKQSAGDVVMENHMNPLTITSSLAVEENVHNAAHPDGNANMTNPEKRRSKKHRTRRSSHSENNAAEAKLLSSQASKLSDTETTMTATVKTRKTTQPINSQFRQTSAKKENHHAIDVNKTVSFDIQDELESYNNKPNNARSLGSSNDMTNIYYDSDEILPSKRHHQQQHVRKPSTKGSHPWPTTANKGYKSSYKVESMDDQDLLEKEEEGMVIEEELESLAEGEAAGSGGGEGDIEDILDPTPTLPLRMNSDILSSLDTMDMMDSHGLYTQATIASGEPLTATTTVSNSLNTAKASPTMSKTDSAVKLSPKLMHPPAPWQDADDLTVHSIEKSHPTEYSTNERDLEALPLQRMSLDVVDALSLASQGTNYPSTAKGRIGREIPSFPLLETLNPRISTSKVVNTANTSGKVSTASRTNRTSIGTRQNNSTTGNASTNSNAAKLSIDMTGSSINVIGISSPAQTKKGTRIKGSTLHNNSLSDKIVTNTTNLITNTGVSDDPLDLSCDSLESSLHISGINASQSRTNLHPLMTVNQASMPPPSTAGYNRTAATTTTNRRRINSQETTTTAMSINTLQSNPVVAHMNGSRDELGNVSVGMIVDSEEKIVDDQGDETECSHNGMVRTIGSVDPIVLEEHQASVTRLRIPKKANLFLLSASLDGTIRLWQGSKKQSKAILDVMQFNNSNAATSNSSTNSNNANATVASSGTERRVSLGTSNTEENEVSSAPTTISNSRTSGAAAIRIFNLWSDDQAETVWGACSDGHVRVWQDTKPLRALKGHEEAITCLEGMDSTSSCATAFSSSSMIVATGSNDRTIRIWDTRAKKAQVFVFRGHGDNILTLKWFDSGRAIVSGSKDKTIKIWDTRAGRLRTNIEKHFGAVHTIRIVADQSSPYQNINNHALANSLGTTSNNAKYELPAFISAGRDSTLHFWNMNGDCIASQTAHRGHVTYLSDINHSYCNYYRPTSANYSFVPMALSIGTDNLIKVWDLKRGKCITELSTISAMNNPTPGTAGGSNSTVTKATWCGNAFLTSSHSGQIKLFERTLSSVATDAPALPDSSAAVKASSSLSSEWSVQDMPSHSNHCTDLVSIDNMAACSSKSGRIFRWNW